MSEQNIENDLIAKLGDLKYTYLPHVHDRAALEKTSAPISRTSTVFTSQTASSLACWRRSSRRIAARQMGSASSERERATSAANGRLSRNGGPPLKPLEKITCTCGAGMALEGHRARCLRGQAIRRRVEKGMI